MSTSAQIGYLAPAATMADGTAELNDLALDVFLQGMVVGCTGLPGNRVFPRWQPEPPTLPPYGTTWAAVGVQGEIEGDVFAFVQHRSKGEGTDVVYRNEILPVVCSAYGPTAGASIAALVVGLQVAQNQEAMQLQGYGLVDAARPLITAELVHERWLKRVDITIRLRRAQQYTYSVLNLLSATGTVVGDNGAAGGILINSQTVVQLPVLAWGLQVAGVLDGWGVGSWK